ncbi:MAG: cell division protein FtsA [Fusobacteriaceae bacterium]|nr:cell division protein FtsA [Fusobacteriaceae bacterium]MBP6322477.1 cell division protein FtsA [Fusobacteriaceae bacterium]MBP9509714.1 cell division protein FtsA [Fusobacteriaceae bacterium]
MTNQKEIIKTAVDIGNSKIKVLVAELYDNGQKVRVLGYVESNTKGLKKSMIVNPEELTASIDKAIKEMEYKLDRKIDKVTIGISSPNIKSRTVSTRISFPETVITEKEIDELYREAEKELINLGEKVIKKEMYNIRVNNSGILKNPKGVTGKELQADIHLISMKELELSGYEEVINRVGLSVERITLNAYCSGESVLDEEEKNKGVALIDIGEGITDIIMYKNSKMIHSKSIALGCMHYVSDLSYILEITKEEALDIIQKLKDKNIEDDKIIVNEKSFTVNHIRKIIDARTEDIAKFILDTIEESGFNGYLGKGIIITGGAIVLDELIKKISEYTAYKVVKKEPILMVGLSEKNPAMASVIGIMLEVMKDEFEKLQNIKKEEEEEKIEDVADSSIPTLEIIQENEEPKKEKISFIEKIKEFFGNYV